MSYSSNRSRRGFTLLFLLLFLYTGTPLFALNPFGTAGQPRAAKAHKKAVSAPKVSREVQQISPELMARHIGFLASDAMKGRNTPSPELDQAARYIAAEMDSLGIGMVGGTRFQEIPFQTKGLDQQG